MKVPPLRYDREIEVVSYAPSFSEIKDDYRFLYTSQRQSVNAEIQESTSRL